MSSNLGKKLLFSNLSYRTTESNLIKYFSTYGIIEELKLSQDDQNQSLRKGFLIYQEISSVNNLMLNRPHMIDHRSVHIQRSIPNEYRTNQNNISEQLGMNLTVNEIFISRLCSGEKREMFIKYFQSYGNIIDCRVLNSHSSNPRQTGYAFLRFTDYDSVDQIILSRPHRINSKFYHVRKSIPREYNYIVSSIKPISQNKSMWRHWSLGLINMKTHEITYPPMSSPPYQKEQSPPNDFTLIDSPSLTVSVDQTSIKADSTNEFEMITSNCLSSSSISIVNSNDHFTPLYSPAAIDSEDKQSYELI